LINSRAFPDAVQRLRSLITDFPEWPYSYFYLALITNERADFQQAVNRCAAFRKAGIAEPEHLLFEVMSLTFLSRFDDARAILRDLKNTGIAVEDVTLIRVSPQTPEDILDQVKAIAQKVGLPIQKRNGAGLDPLFARLPPVDFGGQELVRKKTRISFRVFRGKRRY